MKGVPTLLHILNTEWADYDDDFIVNVTLGELRELIKGVEGIK